MNYLMLLGMLCIPLAYFASRLNGVIGNLLYGIIFLIVIILMILDIKFDYANCVKTAVEDKE